MNLTGIYRCNDGGIYYIRDIDVGGGLHQVAWFGERGDKRFANVFWGEYRETNPILEGRWFDVPKGRTDSYGTISLRINPSNNTLRRENATGGFGGSFWQKCEVRRLPFGFRFLMCEGYPFTLIPDSRFTCAGFEENNLTGTWMGDDGGVYYVREIENELIWYGESSGFSNVFVGTIDRSGSTPTIRGRWMDVPKRRILNNGILEFTTPFNYKFSRTSATGGFGGSEWYKVKSIPVRVRLDSLTINRTEDSSGDEPYLWTFFIKVDGSGVNISDLSNSNAIVSAGAGSQHNLTDRENLPRGTVINIPGAVGEYNTCLITLRGGDPNADFIKDNTYLAILILAFEEDESSNEAMEAGKARLLSLIQEEVTNRIRSLDPSPVGEETIERIRREVVEEILEREIGNFNILGLMDRDDFIGNALAIFRYSTLESSSEISLNFNVRGDGADYTIRGRIEVD